MNDQFKVGDTVYCAVHGKGKVTRVAEGITYPVGVKFDTGDFITFTHNGESLNNGAARTLFFSPPQIVPGATVRPYTPRLIGHTVCIRRHQYLAAGIVVDETEDNISIRSILDTRAISSHSKDGVEIYELSKIEF